MFWNGLFLSFLSYLIFGRSASQELAPNSVSVEMNPDEVRRLELERLKLTVEVWKKTVDVQQHFNDLELRIRNFALTLLVGILGGTAFAIQQGFWVAAGQYQFSLATLLLTVGLVAWVGFYILDRHWYHRLLVGSVEHGQSIEIKFAQEMPELSLARAISKASHLELKSWQHRVSYHLIGTLSVFAAVVGPLWLLRRDLVTPSLVVIYAVGALILIALARAILITDWKIRARHRIDFFYGSIAIMLLILAWAASSAVKLVETTPSPIAP